MDSKDKKWESGPMQDTDDKRTEDQLLRAKEESERRKENLDDKGEGSYKEKNGGDDEQYTDLKSEPKQDKRPTKTSS